MTLVYKKAYPGHHMRTTDNEVFLVTNDQNRILHHARPGQEKNFKVPLEVFESDEAINLKFDLNDPGIAICSQAVPPLFADNFDCQSLDEFVKGVIQDDLTTNSLHLYEVGDDCYASRITNLHTYFAAKHDIIHRWLYPIVPEMSPGKTISKVSYGRHNIYKSSDAQLRKGSALEEDVLLGSHLVLGENSSLHQTVVGNKCEIGKNVTIKNCIIFNNVKIGDNCNLADSVIGNGVVLENGIELQEKCVLGDSVHIKKDAKLPKATWLVSEKPKSGFSDDEDEDSDAQGLYGPKAVVYHDEDEDEDSDSDVEHVEDFQSKWGKTALDATEDIDDSDDSEDDDSDFGMEDTMHNFEIDDEANFRKFNDEVFESLERGAKEGIKVDNLVLEVNSSRHAYAVTQTQVVQSVLASILQIAASHLDEDDVSNPKKLLVEVNKCLKMFMDLLNKYIKTSGAQADCLSGFESFCLNKPHFLPIVAKVIQKLYDEDVLSDDAIFKWFESSTSTVKAKAKPFVEWLEEEDDDDDDDDEDESD